MAQQSPIGQGLPVIEASRSHSDTPHWVDVSGRVISPTQPPLPDNSQHSQNINIHAPGGIRTLSPSKRAAADPRFRPRGHWDRPLVAYTTINYDRIIQNYFQNTEKISVQDREKDIVPTSSM